MSQEVKVITTNYGPEHTFEVVYTLTNKKTGEVEKGDFFTTMALSDNNTPIPTTNSGEYLNQVKLGLSEYIINSKISKTSNIEDWDISVEQFIEITADTSTLSEMKFADRLQDSKWGLCWEDSNGKIYKNSEAVTPNTINGFSSTGWLLSEKVSYYVPVECGTRTPSK